MRRRGSPPLSGAMVRRWVREHKRQLLLVLGGLVGLLVIIQILYPGDRLVPFAKVDGVDMSGWQKKDAAWELDSRYKTQPIQVYFGNNSSARRTPAPSQIGLSVENNERVESLSYPWYIRLIPTSLFWQAHVYPDTQPQFERSLEALDAYIKKELGDSCDIKPINASLEAKNAKLTVVPAASGGTCELVDVKTALKTVTPDITKATDVRIPVNEIPPKIGDEKAQELADVMNAQLEKGIRIEAGSQKVTVKAAAVAGWIETKVSGEKLVPYVNIKRADSFFDKELAPKVHVNAGITKVATRDFLEVSRQTGPSGKTLDATKTGEAIIAYLTAKEETIAAETRRVAPKVVYSRSYSPTDTGLSALMKNYADDHDGVFGVQLIELSGQRRRADYQGSKQFVTASTYKLFVAYGTLKKIEAGSWHWSDQVSSGRDMAACFDDMIVKSDNACAEALLKRYGYNNLTRDIRALGLSDKSGFIGESPKSTAGDLGLFLALLKSGQMLDKQSSRDRLIGAMKRNVYRQGIPAGAKGQVADKVGFLNELLHDAAIVYSPSGTYVLVIMTDGSAWANIAELTRKIEILRTS